MKDPVDTHLIPHYDSELEVSDVSTSSASLKAPVKFRVKLVFSKGFISIYDRITVLELTYTSIGGEFGSPAT